MSNHTPSSGIDPLLGAALELTILGPSVFLIASGKKAPPLVKVFSEFASRDQDLIRAQWAKSPGSNIGVATGRASIDALGRSLVVFDIDRKRGVDGFDSFLSLGLSSGALAICRQSFRVKTPNSGHHIYFWSEPGEHFSCSVSKLGPGIDVRGEGGYVVGPGSRLVDQMGQEIGRYETYTDGPILQLPNELAALLRVAAKACVRVQEASHPVIELDRDDTIDLATRWLVEEAPAAIEGTGGDAATYGVALRLRDFGVSEATAVELMAEHWNEAKATPTWDPWELEQKIANAYAYGRNAPGSAHPAVRFGGVKVTTASPDQASWPIPQPLPSDLPPVAPFNPDLLPEPIRTWVMDIADRMQCPADFVAVAAIVALGSVLGRKVAIRPQRETPWVEVANLWGCIVARPGAMKSPAMAAALAPLKRLDAEACKRNAAAKAKHASGVERFKLEHKARVEVFKQRLRKDPNAEPHFSLGEAAPPAPPSRRHIVHDQTYEALGVILAENPNGTMVFRDELVSLLRPLDREEFAAARGFYLAAWGGKDSYAFDRITRESVRIEGCCVSLLGAAQPGRWAAYLTQAVRGGASDDGFAQRFGLTVWPDAETTWKEVDRPPDEDARRAVEAVFDRLDALDTEAVGAARDDLDPHPFLRFDLEALAVFQQWRARLEARIRAGDLHPAMEGHIAKYRGLAPKLALIFQLVDTGRGPVGVSALNRALAWIAYLESHAARAYASVTAAPATCARAILCKLRAGDLTSPFTARQIKQARWAGLNSSEDVDAALTLLVDLDWLVESVEATAGRPKTVFLANPRAFEPFEGDRMVSSGEKHHDDA